MLPDKISWVKQLNCNSRSGVLSKLEKYGTTIGRIDWQEQILI